MAVYLCHEFPDLYEHDAQVIDARPGRVVLEGGGHADGPARDARETVRRQRERGERRVDVTRGQRRAQMQRREAQVGDLHRQRRARHGATQRGDTGRARR